MKYFYFPQTTEVVWSLQELQEFAIIKKGFSKWNNELLKIVSDIIFLRPISPITTVWSLEKQLSSCAETLALFSWVLSTKKMQVSKTVNYSTMSKRNLDFLLQLTTTFTSFPPAGQPCLQSIFWNNVYKVLVLLVHKSPLISLDLGSYSTVCFCIHNFMQKLPFSISVSNSVISKYLSKIVIFEINEGKVNHLKFLWNWTSK